MTIATKLTSLISTQKEVCSHCPHDMEEIPEGVIIYSCSDPEDAALTHLFHYHCVLWESGYQHEDSPNSLNLTLKDRAITITYIDNQTIQEYHNDTLPQSVQSHLADRIEAYLAKAPNGEELRKNINKTKMLIAGKTAKLSQTFCELRKQETLLQSNILLGNLMELENTLNNAEKPISEEMLGRAVIKAAELGLVTCVELLVKHGTISPKDRGLAICAVLANVDLVAHRKDAPLYKTDTRYRSPSALREDIIAALLPNYESICQEELDKAYILYHLLPKASPLELVTMLFAKRDELARPFLVISWLTKIGRISPICLDLVEGIEREDPNAKKQAEEFVKLDTEGYLKAVGEIEEEEEIGNNTTEDAASNTNSSTKEATSANSAIVVTTSPKKPAHKPNYTSYVPKLATLDQPNPRAKTYVPRYAPVGGYSALDAILERSTMIFLKAVTPSIAVIAAAAAGGAFIALGVLNPVTLAFGITAIVATVATGILFLASETLPNSVSTIIEIAQIAFPLIAGICSLIAFAQLGIASPITIALLVTAGVGLIVSIAVSYFSLKPGISEEVA